MMNRVTRTDVASIRNHQQVRADLDSLGFTASKLWNVARWTCDRIWDEPGTIPDHGTFKAYLKSHERNPVAGLVVRPEVDAERVRVAGGAVGAMQFN